MTPTTTPMAGWLESAWLARYLDRQLSGDEAAWFEAYLLDKPELLGMVEVDNELRDGLAADKDFPALADDSECAAARASDVGAPGDAGEPFKSSLRGASEFAPEVSKVRRATRWLAIAASLIVGLSAGWFGQHSRRLDEKGIDIIGNPTRIVFDTMRGEVVPPKIEHAGDESDYVLIETAMPDNATDIALAVDERAPIALQVAPDGFVTALVRRNIVEYAKSMRITYKLNGTLQQRSLDSKTTKEAGQ
ncbi:MAG: hypothetical protein ABIW82_11350 [Dokdonella sp.]